MTTEGHGHVKPRTDGQVAACGGPRHCYSCQDELRELEREKARPPKGAFPVPPPAPGRLKLSLPNCTRCGGSHPELLANRFHRPFQLFTHWAMCPETGDPIMLKVDPWPARGGKAL